MQRSSNNQSEKQRVRSFWQKYPEKEELNQYWYSKETVQKLAAEVLAETTQYGRVAFLSTPSVYFAVKSDRSAQNEELDCFLFDFDEKFATEGSNFVPFDFNKPESVPRELHKSFNFVIIDPPFITREVWQQYALTAKLLLRSESSKILLTTIEENAEMMQSLLGCAPQKFKPSIPHLVYQYALYTNYESAQLCALNPELE